MTNDRLADRATVTASARGIDPPPVTVIGLGPMGQAMARTLMAAGHRVIVWNRTPARADGVVADGAERAESVASAIGAGEVVILSLTDYRAMYDILGDGRSLRGAVLVNLSSDTPERTREAATWAAGHGAEFLTGGVMVPAPMIGTDASSVYYSGQQRVFDAIEPVLRAIGAPRYLGEDPAAAQLMYQAQLDVFLTALAGLLHGTALAAAAGVAAADFVPQALDTLGSIPAMVGDAHQLGSDIDAGEHPGDLSTVTMMGATADHIVSASAAVGIDLELAAAVQSLYRRAVATGHAKDNWSSLIEVIRPTR